jgi:hypothetical protein
VSTALEACPESTTILPQPKDDCRPSPWFRAARIGVEAVLGGGVGAVGELVGAYAGLNIDLLNGREGGVGTSLGAALGAVLTVAPAVWLGGRVMGGDGSFGWTLLGGTAGTALAAGIIAIKNTTATWVIAALMPVAGAILGYELSSHRKRPPAQASTGVTIVPSLGPNSIGIVGVF